MIGLIDGGFWLLNFDHDRSSNPIVRTADAVEQTLQLAILNMRYAWSCWGCAAFDLLLGTNWNTFPVFGAHRRPSLQFDKKARWRPLLASWLYMMMGYSLGYVCRASAAVTQSPSKLNLWIDLSCGYIYIFEGDCWLNRTYIDHETHMDLSWWYKKLYLVMQPWNCNSMLVKACRNKALFVLI